MRRLLSLAGMVLLLAVMPTAQAGKVRVWHHQLPAHHERARFQQVVLTSEGTLRLAHQLKPLASLDATHVWDIVEDADGNLFVATGSEGKVYRVGADGTVSTVFDGQESQVFCLARAADGSIYAGTAPSGLIVQITADGNSRVLYDSPENYVWSLAIDPKTGAIYAGTGPRGRIYRVTPDGKANLHYTTRQEHILALAVAGDGMLLAGTDKNGLVYRIDSQGKGFVLYQSPQSEIRALLADPQGIYAGTSIPVRRRPPAVPVASTERSGSSNSANVSPANRTAAPPAEAEVSRIPTQQVPGVGSSEESDRGSSTAAPGKDKNDKGTSAPAPSTPAPGENSVFRINPDGTVREIFREKAMVLSLLRDKGRLLVGTGMDGRLFSVEETTRERTEIARLDHGQIQALCRRRGGSIVIGTGDPGKLYVLEDQHVSRGTVVSEVLDAKMIAKWGALRWNADTPPGTTVTVALRSGNVSEPDDTWSDWSAEQTNPTQAVIAAPPARFLQYRVTLTSSQPAMTPSVTGLTLRYMTANLAPEVTAVEVPDLDAVNLDQPKKLKIKWTAVDPNEDELTYSLYIRKDGWKNWVQLEENLTKTEYEWDTTTTPAGLYRVKVTASDARDNPAAESLTGDRISSSLAVAHDPPQVSVKVAGMDGDRAVIEATATDSLVRLTSAQFALNGGRWINVFPTDGLFDSKTEFFRFTTDAVRPGTYVLVLRVRDAAGNIGSGDVVFTVQPRQRSASGAQGQ